MQVGMRVLRVLLSTGTIAADEYDQQRRLFLGGRGINRYLLLAELQKDVTAFSPRNKLVFGTGLLTGTRAAGACRLQVDSLSPFNGAVASANGGGFFAEALKSAGYDHLVLEGAAEEWVYVHISRDSVRIISAEELLGQSTWATHDFLKERHGDDVSILTIGPAGERLVKSAAIIIDKYRAAARCGVGAVMGSKRVKAIVAQSCHSHETAVSPAFDLACGEMQKKILSSQLGKDLVRCGTPISMRYTNRLSWNPVRNFQDCHVEPNLISRLYPENWQHITSSPIETCSSCPTPCGFLRTITSGPYNGTRTANVEANAFWDFATRFDIYDPCVVIKAQEVCNKLGLDIDGVSCAVAWAYECFEHGLIGEKDTDGLVLKWGNGEALIELLWRVSQRKGLGDLLAGGCLEASTRLGQESQKYCVHVKGQDLKEPVRTVKGWALGVMVSPRAGTHTRGCPETEILGLSREAGERFYGVPTAGDPLSYEGKAKLVVHFERLMALADSLGLCTLISEWNGPDLPNIEDYADLVREFTDSDVTLGRILETAERIVTVEKYFNQVHAGFAREHDYPPERLMMEPVKTGPHKGEKLERESWDKMLDEYYAIHGWDPATGRVPDERLRQLELV